MVSVNRPRRVWATAKTTSLTCLDRLVTDMPASSGSTGLVPPAAERDIFDPTIQTRCLLQ